MQDATEVDAGRVARFHLAALYGSAESCEMLMDALEQFELKRHASIRGCVAFILAKNKNRRTSIHEAARAGNVALLDLYFRLIRADTLTDEFDENRRVFCDDADDEYKTSLHLSAAAGEFPSNQSSSPSFLTGHRDIVKFLVEQGANVGSCDMNDSTALHEAAAHNRYSCLEILLRHRASINQYDGKHYTPLHRASEHGHEKIVRLLLEHHADVGLCNCDGHNGLEVAILNNHQSCVREFLDDKTWMKSLRNAQVEGSSNARSDELSTPLRKLIRSMPVEAHGIFTRCIAHRGSSQDDEYRITFNYEFLEDQLSSLKWKHDENTSGVDACNPSGEVASNVTHRWHLLTRNHPLYLIVTHRQYDLLKHSLIDQLIKRKWLQFSRTFFWLLFLFYGRVSSYRKTRLDRVSFRLLPSLVYVHHPSCSSPAVLLRLVQCIDLHGELQNDLVESTRTRLVRLDEEESLRHNDQMATVQHRCHPYCQECASHLHSCEDVLRPVEHSRTTGADSERSFLARLLLLADVPSISMLVPMAMRRARNSLRLDHLR